MQNQQIWNLPNGNAALDRPKADFSTTSHAASIKFSAARTDGMTFLLFSLSKSAFVIILEKPSF